MDKFCRTATFSIPQADAVNPLVLQNVALLDSAAENLVAEIFA
jgi:hypothetical protein